jgi:hypothetical protein
VQQWLGELALALKEESYRPDPIRRVFIPKANSTPSLQPSQGLITAAPAASKGPVSRVATVNPLAAAMAAM